MYVQKFIRQNHLSSCAPHELQVICSKVENIIIYIKQIRNYYCLKIQIKLCSSYIRPSHPQPRARRAKRNDGRNNFIAFFACHATRTIS